MAEDTEKSESVCKYCGAAKVVRGVGQWQFDCNCSEKANAELNKYLDYKPPRASQPEQPKDNTHPLKNLIVSSLEHELETIAANLEMLKSATKEQNRTKCVLTLEIAHITGEGGIFDDLKEAFE